MTMDNLPQRRSIAKKKVTGASIRARLATNGKAMGMFLQDPALSKLHMDYQFAVEDDYLRGTGSSRVVIQDIDANAMEMFPGLDWANEPDLSFDHFEELGLTDNPQFHQVNTFAVINAALDMIEEEIGHEVEWKDGGALIVRPHAFEGMNAFYDPQYPSLNFGYFNSPFRRAPVWTCLSHDVVTHELGHAILDSFRPLYNYSFDLDTPALHESFADLMAMFSALQHRQVVKVLYKETHGDMRHPSLITRLAEEFGLGVFGGGSPYLRSALEGTTYSNAPKEPHARSTVWTAAIYDILERLVRDRYPQGFAKTTEGFIEFCNALAEATRWIKGMLLRALHYTPPTALTMPMMARLIYEADAQVFPSDSKFRDIAKEVFVQRELWNEKLDLRVDAGLGQAFRDMEDSDPVVLNRLIAQHADALRIPADAKIRILNPRLITTTREVDKVNEGGAEQLKEMTEHYLEYVYETSEYFVDFSTGGLVPFSTYGGSTLVMDANWNAVVLATYPEIYQEDAPGAAGIQQAWSRAREQFDKLHGDNIQKTIAARNENRKVTDRPVVAGCPFIIQHLETGGYRLVRRRCGWADHVKRINATKHGLLQS